MKDTSLELVLVSTPIGYLGSGRGGGELKDYLFYFRDFFLNWKLGFSKARQVDHRRLLQLSP